MSVDTAASPVVAGEDPAAEAVARRSQEEALRLQQALRQWPPTADGQATTVTDESLSAQVRWLEPQRPLPMPVPPPQASEAPVTDLSGLQVDFQPPATKPRSPQPSADRQVILDELRQSLRRGDEPALRRAVMAAGLSLADPSRQLAPADLEDLSPAQRELIDRYHRLIVQLGMQLADKQARLQRGEVEQLLQGLLPQPTLTITNLQLCLRVRGFGVYEPFPGTIFLAGRAQKAIVYVELDHFLSRDIGSREQARHQVKLQQDVSILNQADGLEVWKAPTATITDESRQMRRDFFVVQMIEIPANLGVGKYQLRVRVTDIQAQTSDESLLPFSMVADPGLTHTPAR